MTLKLNGYSTAQFGKCHEVPVWQSSPLGPFDAWPRVAVGSRRSTASSVARTTNGIRRCMTVRRPWSRPGLQKRADDLLRRRNHGHRLRVRYHGHLGLQRNSRFTGKINWVQLDLGKDDHDHFIDPEERLRIALSRQ